MLARAGLAAGGLAVLAGGGRAEAVTTRFDDLVEVVPPPGTAAMRLVCSGSVPASSSTGGALNLDNSASSGAGAVLYSDRGADALGRLLVVNQAGAENPQHAVRIQNAGTAHTVSIFHDPAGGAGDPTAEAMDIVSTNELDTALGVRGRESGKGTVKITHAKPDGPDPNASALSIALEGAGTACQGIYIGNDAGNPTTGDLLNIRNGGPGTERLRLTADGELRLAAGAVEAPALRLTPVDVAVENERYVAAQLPVTSTITLGEGGGLRGFAVGSSISTNGTLDQTSLLMYGATSEVTPSGPTNMQAIEVFKSSPVVNGLPGTPDGLVGSTFSSFQHQLRLRPIAKPGTGRITNVFGFYSPPVSGVEGGWTVNNYSLLRLEAPGGTGTIINLTGVDIRDLRSRGFNTYSVRSFGPAVHMRHSGGVSLGAQATPASILHLRGNASYHGSLTLEQETGDPSAPAPRQQARIYVKSGRLVVQWHDGGKTLFTSIPLESAEPYPVTVPVTTDTTPP